MTGFFYDLPAEDIAFGAFGVFYFIVMMITLALSIGVYILSAIGQMRMSKKCGVDKPWLAFIPVANAYNLGKLAERCDDGKPTVKKYSKILLGLNIATLCSSIVLGVGEIFIIICTAGLEISGNYYGGAAIGGLLLFMLAALLCFALAVVAAVFNYIALYRVFRIFAPDNAVLFLVLTIFVSIAYPVIMLVLSAKEPVLLRRDYYTPYGTDGRYV